MKPSEIHIQALLKKLKQQQLSPNERHELEKMALDDPFLFEALEGYQLRLDQEKIRPLSGSPDAPRSIKRFISIAASFMLLAALVYFIKPLLLIDDSSVQVADVMAQETTPAQTETFTSENIEESQQEELASRPTAKAKDENVLTQNKKDVIKESEGGAMIERKMDQSHEQVKKNRSAITEESQFVTDGLRIEEDVAMDEVDDAEGQGSAIQNEAEPAPVMARAKKETTGNADVSAYSIPGPSATPDMGWNKFQAYLTGAVKQHISCKGQVDLRYKLDANGFSHEHEVVRSLSTVCDSIAISIMTESGKWSLVDGSNSKLHYQTITFD